VNELYASVFSKIYNFHTVGLRYFNVFGPRQNPRGPYAAVIPLFIQASLNSNAPIINGDGKTSRDFTFVENVVQANIKSMLADNITQYDVFNIACGDQISLNDLWKSIEEIALINLSPVHREERKGDVKHSLADISKARNRIGYNPVVPFKRGLQITYHWLKDNTGQ
jgi:UDP-N-acetylglucosamine 4-epimerase